MMMDDAARLPAAAATARRRRRRGKSPRTRSSSSPAYTKKEYRSDNGMLTSVWGPSAWHLLHTMSFNYPTHPSARQQREYRAFVLNMQNVLPCGKCRENFAKNLVSLPLHARHMKSRATFSRYIFRLHELVNAMLGKKSGLTYAQVRDRYEHFRARCRPAAAAASAAVPSGGNEHDGDVETGEPTSRRGSRCSAAASARRRGGPPHREPGCTEPMKGQKTKCILRIVPVTHKCHHDFFHCSRGKK